MITNFKIFENIDNLQVDDWIVIKKSGKYMIVPFLGYNSGQMSDTFPYMVKLNDENYPISEKEIIFLSSNKKDCEIYTTTKKYNL